MKKLSIIIATMFLTFSMQAQNQHGNSSVHTYSTGNNNNNHSQNNGNYSGNNHQVNNSNSHNNNNWNQAPNGHYSNNNNYNNGNHHYGNNNNHQHGNNGNNYGNHYPNNHYPNQYHYQHPIVITPPIVVHQPVYYGPSAMNSGAFQTLKTTIDNQWFSSDQMNVFSQALASNYFTAQQVTELVYLFDFNSDQLKVAKMAYTKTVDPENYFIVNNALQYSSSVRELSAYIASI